MHLADMGTEEYLHDLNVALLENEQSLAAEAKAALDRLDQGTFGECEVCGETIPEPAWKRSPTHAAVCTVQRRTVQDGASTSIPGGRTAPIRCFRSGAIWRMTVVIVVTPE